MIYLWEEPFFSEEDPGRAFEDAYKKWYPFLSRQRREKVQALRMEKDRRQSVAVFLLLRYALWEEYEIGTVPSFVYAGGKPELMGEEFSAIHMNLSHCDSGCACALSRFPVGVDMQTISPFRERVARYAFSPREKEDPSPETFTRIFTCKEAWGKYTGRGIAYPMREMDFSEIQEDCWQQRESLWWYSHRQNGWAFSVYAGEPLPVRCVGRVDVEKCLTKLEPMDNFEKG